VIGDGQEEEPFITEYRQTAHDVLPKPEFHLARHVMSCHVSFRHDMHFGIGKSRDETCRDYRTTSATRSPRQARLARHVFRGVATAWTGVDMSTSLFSEVVPETDANPQHKRLNLYTRALLLIRRPPCWNKHGATRSTRRIRVVSRRDVTSQVEFGLQSRTGSK